MLAKEAEAALGEPVVINVPGAAANSAAARKFLEDAGEQVAIRKGAALCDYITREYEAMGVVAKSLKLSPQ